MSPRSGGAGKEQRRPGRCSWPSLGSLSSSQTHLSARPRSGGAGTACRAAGSPCIAADRSRPRYFLRCRPANGRAHGRSRGQVGSAGGCAAGGRDAPWAPAAPRPPHLAAPAGRLRHRTYRGPACVHVISLVVRAGVRPWVPSTLPPAPTPTSFLCLSLGSSASSRKPSESARACGNLFVVGRPHPLHSLQQASLARISQNNLHGVVYLSTATPLYRELRGREILPATQVPPWIS